MVYNRDITDFNKKYINDGSHSLAFACSSLYANKVATLNNGIVKMIELIKKVSEEGISKDLKKQIDFMETIIEKNKEKYHQHTNS